MNILLIGSGGREHALAWKIAKSPLLTRLVCAPGNPGMEALAEVRAVKATDVDAQVSLAQEIAADLVVIGPEVAVEAGLADALAKAGIPCFGPSGAAGGPGSAEGLHQGLRRPPRPATGGLCRVRGGEARQGLPRQVCAAARDQGRRPGGGEG